MEFSSQEVGTGYTMLYILLIEIIRSKKDLIIIDEIESHLQPGLVRLLINLIRNHGESQYIIATHSAPVMETAKGEDILYRFNKKDGMCKFENFF
ncbi:AAA family ATPase [Bacillus paranthracis]